jgi:hypothetical protein
VAVAFNALDNLLRRGVHIRPAAMIGKFKLFAMVGDGLQHLMRLLSAVRQGGRGENAAHDDAGKQMPRLRLQANLDGHVIAPTSSSRSSSLLNARTEKGRLAQGTPQKCVGRGPRPAVEPQMRLCAHCRLLIVFLYQITISLLPGCAGYFP